MIKNKIATALFGLGLSFSAIASTDLDEKFQSDDPVNGAGSALGVIERTIELEGKWGYIDGTNDSFIASGNGRFVIFARDDSLALIDVWQQKNLAFTEYEDAKETYPLDALGFVPEGNKAPGYHLKLGNGEVLGTIFGPAHSSFVRDYLSRQDWENLDFAINFYPLPTDQENWQKFWCATPSVQKGFITKELDQLPEPSRACDTRKGYEVSGSLTGIATVLGIKEVPFLIRHKDWKGGPGKVDLEGYVK